MHSIVDNRFLVTSTVTREVSNYAGRSLEYDWDEVVGDISRAVGEYNNSINLDRRVVAVGVVNKIHLWDIVGSNQEGWKDHIFLSVGFYCQMVMDMIKPTNALIVEPDTHFELLALLANSGCNLTFVNNESLFIFENFVRDLPSYPFSFPYRTVDMQDLSSLTGEFDFVSAPVYDFVVDNNFMEDIVSSVASGGVILGEYGNESGRLYTEDYYMEPVVDVYEQLLDRDDVTSYHLSHGIGYQVIIKK